MRLRIEHTTTFTYDQQVSEAYTEMRLAPLDDEGQRRLSFKLLTQPRSEPTSYADRYRNTVHYFDVLQPHDRLSVTAISEVRTSDRFTESSVLLPLDGFDYLQPSRYVSAGAAFEAMGAALVRATPRDTVEALMHAVHDRMTYEKGATGVHTTALEALEGGAGVCQDYAHVLIACCRAVGIPARYVSGYLYSAAHEALSTAANAASHAWVDAYLPEIGWISLDPTHNLVQDARYVRIAVGRDYADVPPTRGVFTGKAQEAMSVQVQVSAV